MKHLKTKYSFKVLVAQVIFLSILLGTIEVLVDQKIINKLILPAPSKTVIEFIKLFENVAIYKNIGITFTEFIIGFLISLVLGISLGIASASNSKLERFINPFMNSLMSLPKIAILPILIIWFGIGITGKIFFAALFSFFTIFFNTVAGVKQTNESYLKVVRVFGAKKKQEVSMVIIPSAIPTIFAGLRVATTGSFMGALFGELLASNSGLGHLLKYTSGLYNTAMLFAVVLLITLFSVSIVKILDLIERKVFLRWKYLK